MHKTAVVFAFLLVSDAVTAQQRYKAVDPHAVYCETVFEAKQHAGNSCNELTTDQSFELNGSTPDGTDVKAITDISGSSLYMAYIDGAVIPTSAPAPPHDLCSDGDIGPNGEIDRLVISKDGTVKLKRFMVSSKCMHGHMKSVSKPLN